jgi:peptide/nickel transport system permease protein
MALFLFKRTGTALLVLFVTSILVFVGMRAIPGDPATVLAGDPFQTPDPVRVQQIRHKYMLDRPLPVQYGHWIWLVLHGDLGRDSNELPIGRTIVDRLPITLEIACLALFLGALIGLPLGVIAAVRRGKATDHATTGAAVFTMSVPHLWFAYLLITWFAVDLHWLPATGYAPIHRPIANLRHLLLPVIVLGVGIAAHLVRQMRASMLESLGSDYVRTARAKGLNERAVIGRHALRNSLITIVTVLGLTLGGLLSGAAIAESVFGIPGFGSLMIGAINGRDYPMVQAVVLVAAAGYVLASLLVDVAYSLLNPRIRVS